MRPRVFRDREILWFPFWRFRGMVFTCAREGITSGYTDTSIQATGSLAFPLSLGFRSQTQELTLISDTTAGTFIKPVMALKTCLSNIMRRQVRSVSQPVHHQAAVGEATSLVFAPFYKDAALIDAITDTPVSSENLESLERLPSQTTPPVNPIHLIPTLCPGCGWDLTGQPDSLVLACTNCNSFWHARQITLSRLKAAVMPGGETDSLFLPFWRIRAQVEGIPLKTWSDMALLANMPRIPPPDWKEAAFHFWCPAFKLKPDRFLQTASRATLAQPRIRLEAAMPGPEIHPVTLPAEEAMQAAALILGDIMRPRNEMMSLLGSIAITPKAFLLTYLPFRQGPHDFIQEKTGLSVNRAMLTMARTL